MDIAKKVIGYLFGAFAIAATVVGLIKVGGLPLVILVPVLVVIAYFLLRKQEK